MAGQLSNHGHNTWWVNSPGTNWCFLLHKGHLMVEEPQYHHGREFPGFAIQITSWQPIVEEATIHW